MKKESIRDKKHGRERSKKIRESCVDEKSNSTSSSRRASAPQCLKK